MTGEMMGLRQGMITIALSLNGKTIATGAMMDSEIVY
jgi:hypothetical protein